jgi:hypothetical protein
MKMSDKELDKIFSSQLADFEIEPSAAVWNNIKLEINGEEKSRKSYLPFLQIAAAIIVVGGAALMLRPQTHKITLRGSSFTASVADQPKTLLITPEPAAADNIMVTDEPLKTDEVHSRTVTKTRTHSMLAATGVTNADTTNRILANNTAGNTPDQQQVTIQKPVSISATATASIVPEEHARPARTLAALTVPTVKENQAAKKKIRNLGDLLNVVIAKVDKRPKKIIEFKDDDDDDTFNPTHINLGLIETRRDK